jgi:hypothetical protein
MKFVTESGSKYQLTTIEERQDNPIYQVDVEKADGAQTSHVAELVAPIPVEVGSRVMFLVLDEPSDPSHMLTSRVVGLFR